MKYTSSKHSKFQIFKYESHLKMLSNYNDNHFLREENRDIKLAKTVIAFTLVISSILIIGFCINVKNRNRKNLGFNNNYPGVFQVRQMFVSFNSILSFFFIYIYILVYLYFFFLPFIFS